MSAPAGGRCQLPSAAAEGCNHAPAPRAPEHASARPWEVRLSVTWQPGLGVEEAGAEPHGGARVSQGPHLCPVPAAQPSLTASPQTEELFDLIASSQSRRLDDQRASVGSLPGLRITHNNLGHLRGDADPQEPGDEFFNMLIKCQVGLPRRSRPSAHAPPTGHAPRPRAPPTHRLTVPPGPAHPTRSAPCPL